MNEKARKALRKAKIDAKDALTPEERAEGSAKITERIPMETRNKSMDLALLESDVKRQKAEE